MRALSIAVFGNTNNYMLLLAQALISLGHSVRLVLNRKELLHRPEARYPDWAQGYPEWVIDSSHITDEDIAYLTPAVDELTHLLTHRIDLVILNDTGPALSGFLRVPHVAVLTGSDLAYFASYESLRMRTSMWDPAFKRSAAGRRYLLKWSDFVARQRDGILSAEVVCYGQRGLIPSGDQALDEIGVGDDRRMMLFFANTFDLQPAAPVQNPRMRVLCGARIAYRKSVNPTLSAMDFKGVDVLLAGFAMYVKAGGQGELRLVRKGPDVDAAVALIDQLGIGGSVHWLDEMPLSRFYEEMSDADLICDQFGTSFPGMVTTDAYALGRPVMANFMNDVFAQRFPEPLPGFDAVSAEQIAAHLGLLEGDRGLGVEMGYRGRAYAERYLSPESMAQQLLERLGLASVPA
jgi:glycosyltransferase involved in cell wall biosynthesis